MVQNHEINCDLLVIGAGMAGMAASLFAANRGVDTVQIGVASQIIFSSGLLDLLGVHPVEEGKTWDDPFQALDQLTADLPDLAALPYAEILQANGGRPPYRWSMVNDDGTGMTVDENGVLRASTSPVTSAGPRRSSAATPSRARRVWWRPSTVASPE